MSDDPTTEQAMKVDANHQWAEVQRLTAENEALRELLQAFAISPEGVIMRPEQADLYRSVLAEPRLGRHHD